MDRGLVRQQSCGLHPERQQRHHGDDDEDENYRSDFPLSPLVGARLRRVWVLRRVHFEAAAFAEGGAWRRRGCQGLGGSWSGVFSRGTCFDGLFFRRHVAIASARQGRGDGR